MSDFSPGQASAATNSSLDGPKRGLLLPDEELKPHQRRVDDITPPSFELILYQLGELKAAVREGFQRMEGRFDRVEDRLSALERFRERVETRDRTEAQTTQTVNARWVPIAIAIFTTVVFIVLAIIQLGN